MFIWRIIGYIKGYVVVHIEGLGLERFINYAIAKGIYLWDIVRMDYTTLEAKVSLKELNSLRRVVKKAGCRVYVNKKRGYPVLVNKAKNRKMFFIGCFICFFIIVVSTSFIWDIQIKGNNKVSIPTIKKELKRLGVYPGAFKYDLDPTSIENKMMIELKDLAWVGIDIDGTKVSIEIAENQTPPKEISNDVACNIVATKQGLIEKIVPKRGDPCVKEGDIVKEGDLLITGSLEREEMDTRYVHALGEVFARTYYEQTANMNLSRIKKVKTGKKIIKRIIKIGDYSIVLGGKDIPYKDVIIEKKNKSLACWRNIKIPVEIIIEEYYEAVEEKEIIDKELAKKALEEKMMIELMDGLPVKAKILNKDVDFQQKNGRVYAKLIVEALEQIGKKVKLQSYE